MLRSSVLKFAALGIAGALVLMFGSAAMAQAPVASTWDGGGGDDFWLTAVNWNLDTAPLATNSLAFAGAIRLTPNSNFATGTLFSGITFNAGASAFTLSGNAITLGGAALGNLVSAGNYVGLTTNGITNSSTNIQTVNLGVTLAAGNHTFGGGSNGLALNPTGGLLHNPGGIAIFIPGAGGITSTTISNTNGILGGWATVGTSAIAVTDWATVDGTGHIVALPTAGYTDIAGGGTIASDGTKNYRVPTAGANITMAVPGTTNINTLQLSSGTAQIFDIGAGNTLRLGTSGGVLRNGTSTGLLTIQNGTLTAGGTTGGTLGEIVFNAGGGANTTNSIVVSATIADNAGGAVTVVKTGQAAMQITGTNSYTGGTIISEGRLNPGNTNSLGTGPITIVGTGQLFTSTTINNNFFLAGTGTTESNGNGAIRLDGGGVLNGTITLIGNARIGHRSGAGASTINGQITGGFSLEIGGNNNANATPTPIILSNTNNNWTGNTQIDESITLRLGASEVIPNGPGFGNVVMNSNNGATSTFSTVLDLNGFNETINGLSRAGNATALTNAKIENDAPNTTSTLTIGDNNQTSTFDSLIRDNGGTGGKAAIAKIGSGILTLSGAANTYTGGTTVNGGTLKLGSAAAIGGNSAPLTVNTGGTLDLNNNSLTVGTLAGTGGTINSSVAGTPTLTVSNTANSVFGGAIANGAGTVALTKSGNGMLTLSTNSTYTGTTTINAGTLAVTGTTASAGAVSIASGGTLAGNGNGTTTGKVGNVTIVAGGTIRPGTTGGDGSIGSVTLNSLTVNGGDFRVDVGGSSDLVNVVGTANFTAASTFTPFFPGGITSGNYTLLQAGTLTAGVVPTLNFASQSRLTIGLVTTPGANGTVQLSVSGSTKNLTWTGNADHTTWDLQGQQNWQDAGSGVEKYFDLDTVTFDDNSTDHNVVLGVAVQPGSVTVNTAGTYTISGGGSIGGIGGLTVTGGGTLNLSLNNNSYTGATAVQNGTLKLGSSTTLPAAASLTLGSGASSGVLDLNGNNTTVGSLNSAGTGTANAVGNSAAGTAVLTINGSSGTYAGAIQDVLGASSGQKVALTISGVTQTMSGANTYTGDTNISGGGTLRLGSSSALSSGANVILGEATTNTSGTLDLGGFNATVSGLSIAGTGTSSLVGSSSTTSDSTLTFVPATSPLIFGGKIQDSLSGGTRKVGLSVASGTLALSGASTFTGNSSVASGATLVINTNATLPAGSSQLGGTNVGSGVGTVTIASGATLDLSGTTGFTPVANQLNFGQKEFVIAGTGVGGVGAIVNSSANGQQNAFQKITLSADTTINNNGATNAGGRFDVRAAQVGGVNVARLDLASHKLTKIGLGFFGVVGTDVTFGDIDVNAGIFQIESTSNVPGGVGSGTITYNDGTYASFFTNTGNVTRPMVFNGTTSMGTATGTVATIGSNITLNGTTTFVPRDANGTGTLVLTGTITETGGPRTVTKANNGTGVSTLVLSGNNSFTGGLAINGGVVQLGSTGALNSTTLNAVSFSGSLATDTLRLAGNSVTIASLTGGSPLPAVENANATPATLTINDTSSNSNFFAGILRDGTGGGALSLTKNGANSALTLTGISTYTGVTTINGGVVDVGGGTTSGSIANTSSVTGTSGGKLIFDRSDDFTFAPAFTGGVNIAKNQANNVILSGTSTSTGTVDINGGALIVTGALASTAAVNVHTSGALGGNGDGVTTGKVGNVVMDSGSKIQPGAATANSSIGKLTLTALTVNGGDFSMGISSPSIRDQVAVTGTANFTASATSSFTPFFNTVPQAGSYTLLTAGNLIIDPSHTINLTTPSSTTRFSFNLVKTTGINGTIALSVSGSNKSLVWTGAQNSTWDIGSTSPQNWKELPSTVERYFDLDNVTFDDTSNVSTHNVQLNTTVTPTSVTVSANNDYTISGGGTITGTTGLTKSGTGKLTLSNGTNDYSGPTNIQDGTLVIGSSGALSANSALILGGGVTSGTLDMGSVGGTLSGLASSGTGTANAIGSGGTGQSVTLTITGGNSTFVGAVKDNVGTGSGNTVGLNVTSGTLRIDGNNTYSGATSISAGATLRIGNGGATGSLSPTTTITDSGTLDFDRSGTLTVSQSISGSGTLEKHGTGTLILTGGNSYGTTLIAAGKLQVDNGGTTGTLGSGAVTDNGTLTFNRGDDLSTPVTVANVISGTGDVEKLGSSLLVLSGANTYSGTTTISSGVLRATSSASLGTAPGGPVIVSSGTTLDLKNDTAGSINFGQKEIRIAGSGAGLVGGVTLGALSSTSTNNQNNAFQRVVLTGDASIGNPGVPNANGRFDIRAGQVSGQNAALLDLAGHVLTKIGTNQVSLVATDVTPGDIVVQSTNAGLGETRNLLGLETSTNALAATKPDTSPYTITFNDHTAMGTFSNNGTITRQIVYNGDVLTYNNGGGTSTVAAPISLSTGATVMRIGAPENIPTQGTGDYVLTGNITGPGSVIKENSTVARFSGVNTYAGSTTVTLGTLAIGAANRMPDSSQLIMNGGTFSTAGFDEKMGTLAVNTGGTIELGAGASLLQFDNSSVLSWAGSLAINNWSNGLDRVFVGTSAGGLTASQLSAITFTGFGAGASILSTGEIYPVGTPPLLIHGDWNRDGVVNSADVTTMLTALTDLSAYQANFNVLTPQELASIGDFDSTGTITNNDIQPLLDLVATLPGAGSAAPVPEPASLVLLGVGALALLRTTARRRTLTPKVGSPLV